MIVYVESCILYLLKFIVKSNLKYRDGVEGE
jgi:hypothetical protein